MSKIPIRILSYFKFHRYRKYLKIRMNTLKSKTAVLAYFPGLYDPRQSTREILKNMLDEISFVLNEGELLFIKGESGSGKTTFLKIINRLFLLPWPSFSTDRLPRGSDATLDGGSAGHIHHDYNLAH